MHKKKKAKQQQMQSNFKSDGAPKGKNGKLNIKKQQQQKQQQHSKKEKKKTNTNNEPETIQVEFLFCDMVDHYFHGIKTLSHHNAIHAPHSSQLSDLIIENEMVGTVLSTDDGQVAAAAASSGGDDKKKAASTQQQQQSNEANVFGFASIINLTTNSSSPTIQSLKSTCLKYCPSQYKSEMQTVLSGSTARPAGFFFMERMVNVPLEITDVLHDQLVLDMEYAVTSADDDVERKSLDFGAFVRLAPCYKSGNGGGGGNAAGNNVIYKYFDDEVFSTNSEFTYNFEVPKLYKSDITDNGNGEEDNMRCSVIVMTKTGHRSALKELKKMIHG